MWYSAKLGQTICTSSPEEVSRVAELCITQNMGTMGTAKYVPGTRDVCEKKPITLWLTNLTLRSGVNQSTEMDLHPLSSIRILVVDDFKDWLLQVRLLLQPRPKSHVIAEASDGLEAVQKAEDLKPDLILLNIGLPKLNGIEAARQIRQRSPSSKIIFLGQNSDLDVVRAAFGHGRVGLCS